MANKRSSAAVAAEPSRPSKKRKSAEASKAKIKEIAEAEDIDEAEAFPDEKEKTTIEVKRDDEVEEVQRVVAPGFRLWNTTSKMTAGGELSEASMVYSSWNNFRMSANDCSLTWLYRSIRCSWRFILKRHSRSSR